MAGALVGALAVLLLFAGGARAADSVYWVGIDNGRIFRANLAGGAATEVPFPNAGKVNVGGVAVDPGAGRLYWTELGGEGSSIMSANLDGSGAQPLNVAGSAINSPIGITIDARGGRIYWANLLFDEEDEESLSTISYANLDGSGGGVLDTTGARVGLPQGLAVDPVAGRLYWADIEGATISFASLAGGEGSALDIDPALVGTPVGVAIDATAQKVYWGNGEGDHLSVAALAGGAVTELRPGGVDNLSGLALDTAANRLYWSQSQPAAVRFANPLDGSGVGAIDLPPTPESSAVLPVLFKAPVGAGAARVSGARRTGATLTCAATWLPDAPEAQLYRAAQTISYQWMRGGRPIPGATGPTLEATEAASYSCLSVATNGAGSTTSARSAPLAIPGTLKLGRVKTNRAKGTATVAVTVNGAGLVIVAGKDVARATKRIKKSGTYRLTIRPKGKAKRKLRAAARARVKLTVTFAPEGGELVRRAKTIVLRRR